MKNRRPAPPTAPPDALRAAIANLYATFVNYKLKPVVEGCPCCVSRDRERVLHAAPLQVLGADNLSLYASKALTTWGDEDDLRHFLPRLLELVAADDLYTDREIVLGKLRHGRWHEWPAREQGAIRRFLLAWWRQVLAAPHQEDEGHKIEEVLCCIGCATDEIEPFLATWLDPLEARPLENLALWLRSGEALGGAFWHPIARLAVRSWLRNKATRRALEDAFFDPSRADLQGEISCTLASIETSIA